MEGGDHIEEKWETFKEKLQQMSKEWTRDRKRKRGKWRIKSLSKNPGQSKSIWRDLKGGRSREEIRALKVASGEILTNPREIQQEICRYMTELGREREERAGAYRREQQSTGWDNRGKVCMGRSNRGPEMK